MSGEHDAIGDILDKLGWCCGATVPNEMYADIEANLHHLGTEKRREIGNDDWLIVLSQTCDVVAKRLAQEPLIELLLCRNIAKSRREFTNRRSTRHLDFRPNAELHPGLFLTAHAIRDRYLVPRELFEKYTPRTDRKLSDKAVRGLQSWYALRYTRPAWPNDFVDLLKSFKADLEEALGSLSDDDSELRITPPILVGGKYRIAVFLVIAEELAKDSTYRELAQTGFLQFTATINRCDKMDLDDASGVIPGSEFTWQHMRMTEVWNFAFLTPIE